MSGLGDLFGGGGGTPQVSATRPGFNAGGFIGRVDPSGNATVTPTAQRTGLVNDLSGSYQTFGNELGNLRATVAPGYNSLLDARLNQINDAAHRSIGNLRQSLAARRVLGSSFGQDTISRQNAEFSRLRDQAIADNFIRSLEANRQLLGQQYGAYADQFNTGLNELNLEAKIGSALATQGAQILNDTAKINADFTAKSQAGAGQFLGTILGQGTKLALAPTTGGGSLFGNLFG